MLTHLIYVQYRCENQSKVVYSLGSTSTGSISSGDRSVTISVLSTQKMWTLAAPQVRKWSFFSTKQYRDNIESYLSELGYSDFVQGQFEKWQFFHQTPYQHELVLFFNSNTYFIVLVSFVGSLLSPWFSGVLCDIPICIVVIFIFVMMSLDHCQEQIYTSINDKTIYLIIWKKFIVTQKQ